jgi:hypothetical protein
MVEIMNMNHATDSAGNQYASFSRGGEIKYESSKLEREANQNG